MGKIEYPLGIKFWAQHFPKEVPAFRVFRCIGIIDGTSSYIFESVDTPVAMLVMRWDELSGEYFKPFLLPLDNIRKNYGEEY